MVETVTFELLAQSGAIQTQVLGGFGDVAARFLHHHFKQWALDFAKDEIIQATRRMSVELNEVTLHRLFHVK